VTVFLGDVAFLHDVSSLAMLSARNIEIRIVVTNNDGGAIFSYLPQAGALPTETFDRLFGTPHGIDIGQVAAAFGLRVERPRTLDELRLALRNRGSSVVVVDTDRGENLAVHASLNEAITTAVGAVLRVG
jgi:2-succinyl-5-enolpyruvyl-6-hydroxy-3-cyclohexene-1-carboxylate synthase